MGAGAGVHNNTKRNESKPSIALVPIFAHE